MAGSSLKIEPPYREMLDSLRDVKGYSGFIEFLRKRKNSPEDWMAEIKGLFEINKDRHPLLEICSHSISGPEGIFEIHGGVGIIEIASVGYIFPANAQKRKITNKIKGILSPMHKLLTGKYKDYNISITICSTSVMPTDAELEDCKNEIRDFFFNGGMNLIIQMPFGLLIIGPDNWTPSIKPEPEIRTTVKNAGLITQAPNVDLRKKIGQLIKDKRRQHKAHYATHMKVYYFCVGCPPPRLLDIDPDVILSVMRHEEIVIITTYSGPAKLMLSGGAVRLDDLDFSNSYYPASVE